MTKQKKQGEMQEPVEEQEPVPLQGEEPKKQGEVQEAASEQQPVPPAREEPRKLDETVPGGRYLVNGHLVDCNGDAIEE